MNFDETIRLQALKQKQLVTRGMDDSIAEHILRHMPEVPEQTRNICALISVKLFDEVEACCKQLEISKRRFVEMALLEALNRAAAIVDDVNPFMGGEH